jgi:short-subunit dehydrogenase
MQKLVLIVGASSGVGAATAKELAKRGYQVIVSARSLEPLKALVREIGNDADCFACDASTADGIRQLADYIRQNHRVPDVIVNCAGVGQWKRIEETTPEEARQMIGAPYLAAFNASGAFMKEMIARGSGLLIHVNSPACFMPIPASVGYSSARFALRGLHEALCQDLAGTGVRSCHIVFGRIDSEYFLHNPGVLDRMPGIAATIRTLSSGECGRVIARLVERPRKQVVYPWMLSLFYWTHLIAPGVTAWLLRVKSRKTSQ